MTTESRTLRQIEEDLGLVIGSCIWCFADLGRDSHHFNCEGLRLARKSYEAQSERAAA